MNAVEQLKEVMERNNLECFTIEFKYDIAHGWGKVPFDICRDLGILDKISSCSYISYNKQFLYLEEDCDLAHLYYALKDNGIELKLSETDDGDDSPIRNMEHYDPTPYLQAV